jgi:hypothetical protein
MDQTGDRVLVEVNLKLQTGDVALGHRSVIVARRSSRRIGIRD